MTTDSASYLTEIHQLINQHFNLAEIQMLCLDLHVDYESVAGEEKPSRIRELLLGLGRNGRLPELITLLQQERPKVDWPLLPDGFELPESLMGETAVPPNQYHIYGDVVRGDKIGRDKNVVGDVSGQAVVAVGKRAQATINQYTEIIIRADNFEDLPPAPGAPPYKGMAYFIEADKDRFFGRENLSDDLAHKLQTSRFLAVIGASGSGKSSLLRAGIIPRLRARNWLIHIIKPGVHPVTALAATLTQDELHADVTDLIGKALTTNANTLTQTAEKLVARAHAEQLLLAVDQFEELFTQCQDEHERQAFVDNLVNAAQAQGATTILFSMRADFYGRISQYKTLTKLISQQQAYIEPMAEEDLVRAIAEPAKRGGWQFVEGLVEQFVADVGNEPGRLPLLSHALLATWERRRGVVMTLGGYRKAGGVKSAIAQTAEATYAALTASEQLIAKRIFLRLTELGKGTEDTRRRVNQVELGEDTAVQAVTQRLTAARLITTTQDGIDVAHEALIREWPRLREWLDADREGLIIHRRLTDAEREWQDNGQDPSLLYSGFRLNEVEQWVKDNTNALNDLEQTFFTASITERQKRREEEESQRQRELKQAQALAAEQQKRAEEQTAAAKRLRSRNVLFAGAAIAAIALAVVAFIFFGNAQDNLAQATRALIAEATAQSESADNLALAQTRETDAEENLEKANTALDAEATAQVAANENLAVAQTSEAEANAASTRAIESESTAVAEKATAQAAEATAVYNENLAATRAAELAIESTRAANNLATSEAAQATAEAAQAEAEYQIALVATESARADGATAFAGVVAVPAITSFFFIGAGIQDMQEQETISLIESLAEASLSQETSNQDEDLPALLALEALLLNANSERRINGLINDALYYTIVNSSSTPIFSAHESSVLSVDFSPNGQWLASGSSDNSVRLFPMDTPNSDVIYINEHESDVSAVTFSPNDMWLISGDVNGILNLWSMDNLDSNVRPACMVDLDSNIIATEFSNLDEMWLASVTDDKQIGLWTVEDICNSEPVPSFSYQHNTSVLSVTFSPDGQWLAFGTSEGTIYLWSITNPQGEPLELLQSGTDSILSLTWAFSQNMEDEQWLVSSSSDGITHLYRLSTENIPYDIKNRYIIEREFVPQVVTFSPDGQWLVEGRTNGEIRVFGDITLPPIVFDGDSKGIQSVAISPDNQWIASGEDSGNIRLWRLQSEEWFNTGCQQTERNLTWEEWQEYLPSDLQYHCTCPTLPAHSSVPASEIATDAVCAPLP